MHITLDDEQWVAPKDTTLREIFTDLSERAFAKSRIVTTMLLDHRQITDRDIDAQLLQTPSSGFSDLVATSSTQQDIIEAARGSIDRYCEHVVGEGNQLVGHLRTGMLDVAKLDRWLGKVADILELMKHRRSGSTGESDLHATAGWVEQLLGARQVRDSVRMADLLEYEVLPRLSL
jgi:hypothetical protein